MIFSQQFDNILSLLPEGILITNYNGEHLYVNKSYEKFSGVSREHVLKRNIYQLKNEGFFNLFLNPDVIKQRKKITAVQKIKGGRSVILEAHPIFDDSGEVCLVVTFVRDNTSIEILKQQISLQEELLKTFQKIHLSDVNRLGFPFVLESAIMHKFFTKLLMVSASDATILLQGETGTGKDVFARKIHCNSPRAEKPFIKVDCSSLPENLIEAELFGYTAGSFSGAHTRGKIGLIEAASSGTVFLDEVGELPLLMQSRLLRVLQNREIVRIGATSPSPVNVRFIAATNKDLEKEVLCGHFRSDLYYRLKVAEFFVPPLRSHTEDILPMAHIFIEHFSNRYNRKVRLAADTEQCLLRYGWPGNVRELENMMHNLVSSCGSGEIHREDLPIAHVSRRSFPPEYGEEGSLKERLELVEKTMLQEAAAKTSSIKELCALLRINRTTLIRKLHYYAVSFPGQA